MPQMLALLGFLALTFCEFPLGAVPYFAKRSIQFEAVITGIAESALSADCCSPSPGTARTPQ